MKKKIIHILVVSCLAELCSPSALAVGLGNLDVRSSLGEPLVAKLTVHDTNSKTAEECFSFSRQTELGEAKLKADIQLKPTGNNSSTLWIHTNTAISDPIVELSVQYNCDEQLSRHYTLLLDPPIETFSGSSSNSADIAPHDKPILENQPSTDKEVKPSTRKKRGKVSRASSSTGTPASTVVEKPLTKTQESGTAPQQSSLTSESSPSATPDRAKPLESPKLVISSGDNTGTGSAPLALRFEHAMSETPPTDAAPGDLQLNDLSDDMTAMSNKLKHLESQLVSLQKRNQFLEAQQKQVVTPPKLPEAQEDSTGKRYWIYGATALGIVGLLAFLAKRRKDQYLELDDEDNLFDLATEEAEEKGLNLDDVPDQTTRSSLNVKKVDTSKPAFTPEPVIDITEVNEGILEQAEVFVAHGRTSLAITLLQDHLRDHPTISPAPWLLLLSLLKREKMKDEYNTATMECRRYFNFFIPDFNDPVAPDNSSLEDYPNARDKVVQAWGSPEAVPLLDDLIYNRRNEVRQGFDRSAYIDILLLRSIAQSVGLNDINSIANENADNSQTSNTKEEEISSSTSVDASKQIDKTPIVTPLDEPDPEAEALAASQEGFVDAPTLAFESETTFEAPDLSSGLSDNPFETSSNHQTEDDNSIDFDLNWPDKTGDTEAINVSDDALHIEVDSTSEDTDLKDIGDSTDEPLFTNADSIADLSLETTSQKSKRKKSSSNGKDDKSKPLDFDVEIKLE